MGFWVALGPTFFLPMLIFLCYQVQHWANARWLWSPSVLILKKQSSSAFLQPTFSATSSLNVMYHELFHSPICSVTSWVCLNILTFWYCENDIFIILKFVASFYKSNDCSYNLMVTAYEGYTGYLTRYSSALKVLILWWERELYRWVL